MLLRRLSTDAYVRAFDGGYGPLFDGRWNTTGHAVTYCSTSRALCVLEKLVHVEDFALMPPLAMARYDVPDGLAVESLGVADLPVTWREDESWTQAIGDQWYEARRTTLLRVPSAIVPLDGSLDLNVLINPRHPDSAKIRIVAAEPFALDVRLF